MATAKLPLSSAFADFALIGGGIALLVLGNKVVGPRRCSAPVATRQSFDRFTDMVGVVDVHFTSLSFR